MESSSSPSRPNLHADPASPASSQSSSTLDGHTSPPPTKKKRNIQFTPNWQKHLEEQVQQRKAREMDPFEFFVESYHSLQDTHQAATTEMKKTKDELSFVTAERNALKVENANLQSAAEGLERKTKREKELEEQIASLTPQLATALENANKLFEAQDKIRDLSAENTQLSGDLFRAKERGNALQKELSERDSLNALLKQENNALIAENAMQRDSFATANAENSRLMPMVLKAKEQEMELQQRIFELENALKDALKMSAGGAGSGQGSPSLLGGDQRHFKDDLSASTQAAVPIPTYMAWSVDNAHESEIHTVTVTDNSRLVWTGGPEKSVRGWDAAKGSPMHRMGSVASVICLDSRSNYLVGGCGDFTCRVWHIPTQRAQCQLTGHTEVITASYLGVNADQVFTASRDSTIKSWDLNRGALIHTSLCPSSCYDLAVAPDRICTGHFDNTLRFWDIRSGKLSGDIANLHDRAITCVRLTEDGHSSISLGRDNTVRVCDVRMMKETMKFTETGFGISSNYSRLCLSPDGSHVAAGASNGQVFIWTLAKPDAKPKMLKGGHTGAVVSVSWAQDGKGLASVGLDKRLIWWR